MCTVQVKKQLKRRGESSTESGRDNFILLLQYSPSLFSTPPFTLTTSHSLSIYISVEVAAAGHTHNQREKPFFLSIP